MNLRKAAEMALEALEMFCEHGAILRPLETKEALRQALAESANSTTSVVESKALAQPEQEPVAWIVESKHGNWAPYLEWSEPSYLETQVVTPLYTAPPKKEWVWLTHDEVNSWYLPDSPTVFEFAQFIEAKLKEKNGG